MSAFYDGAVKLMFFFLKRDRWRGVWGEEWAGDSAAFQGVQEAHKQAQVNYGLVAMSGSESTLIRPAEMEKKNKKY